MPSNPLRGETIPFSLIFRAATARRKRQRLYPRAAPEHAPPKINRAPRWSRLDEGCRDPTGAWRIARRAQSLHNRGVWQCAGHVTAGLLYLISANTLGSPRRVVSCVHVALIIPFYVTGGRAVSTGHPRALGVSRQLATRFPPPITPELPAFCAARQIR